MAEIDGGTKWKTTIDLPPWIVAALVHCQVWRGDGRNEPKTKLRKSGVGRSANDPADHRLALDQVAKLAHRPGLISDGSDEEEDVVEEEEMSENQEIATGKKMEEEKGKKTNKKGLKELGVEHDRKTWTGDRKQLAKVTYHMLNVNPKEGSMHIVKKNSIYDPELVDGFSCDVMVHSVKEVSNPVQENPDLAMLSMFRVAGTPARGVELEWVGKPSNNKFWHDTAFDRGASMAEATYEHLFVDNDVRRVLTELGKLSMDEGADMAGFVALLRDLYAAEATIAPDVAIFWKELPQFLELTVLLQCLAYVRMSIIEGQHKVLTLVTSCLPYPSETLFANYGNMQAIVIHEMAYSPKEMCWKMKKGGPHTMAFTLENPCVSSETDESFAAWVRQKKMRHFSEKSQETKFGFNNEMQTVLNHFINGFNQSGKAHYRIGREVARGILSSELVMNGNAVLGMWNAADKAAVCVIAGSGKALSNTKKAMSAVKAAIAADCAARRYWIINGLASVNPRWAKETDFSTIKKWSLENSYANSICKRQNMAGTETYVATKTMVNKLEPTTILVLLDHAILTQKDASTLLMVISSLNNDRHLEQRAGEDMDDRDPWSREQVNMMIECVATMQSQFKDLQSFTDRPTGNELLGAQINSRAYHVCCWMVIDAIYWHGFYPHETQVLDEDGQPEFEKAGKPKTERSSVSLVQSLHANLKRLIAKNKPALLAFDLTIRRAFDLYYHFNCLPTSLAEMVKNAEFKALSSSVLAMASFDATQKANHGFKNIRGSMDFFHMLKSKFRFGTRTTKKRELFIKPIVNVQQFTLQPIYANPGKTSAQKIIHRAEASTEKPSRYEFYMAWFADETEKKKKAEMKIREEAAARLLARQEEEKELAKSKEKEAAAAEQRAREKEEKEDAEMKEKEKAAARKLAVEHDNEAKVSEDAGPVDTSFRMDDDDEQPPASVSEAIKAASTATITAGGTTLKTMPEQISASSHALNEEVPASQERGLKEAEEKPVFAPPATDNQAAALSTASASAALLSLGSSALPPRPSSPISPDQRAKGVGLHKRPLRYSSPLSSATKRFRPTSEIKDSVAVPLSGFVVPPHSPLCKEIDALYRDRTHETLREAQRFVLNKGSKREPKYNFIEPDLALGLVDVGKMSQLWSFFLFCVHHHCLTSELWEDRSWGDVDQRESIRQIRFLDSSSDDGVLVQPFGMLSQIALTTELYQCGATETELNEVGKKLKASQYLPFSVLFDTFNDVFLCHDIFMSVPHRKKMLQSKEKHATVAEADWKESKEMKHIISAWVQEQGGEDLIIEMLEGLIVNFSRDIETQTSSSENLLPYDALVFETAESSARLFAESFIVQEEKGNKSLYYKIRNKRGNIKGADIVQAEWVCINSNVCYIVPMMAAVYEARRASVIGYKTCIPFLTYQETVFYTRVADAQMDYLRSLPMSLTYIYTLMRPGQSLSKTQWKPHLIVDHELESDKLELVTYRTMPVRDTVYGQDLAHRLVSREMTIPGEIGNLVPFWSARRYLLSLENTHAELVRWMKQVCSSNFSPADVRLTEEEVTRIEDAALTVKNHLKLE